MENTLSGRLVQLRKQKNLSQYKLAEILGFSRGLLANYEQGRREPDYNTLLIFAAFYNVSVDYLLGGTDDGAVVYSDTDKEWIKTINALSKESREDLKKYADLLQIRDSVGKKRDKKL